MASESAFHVSVKTLIGDWQGLQIAIENGMGGVHAREKEQWLVGVLEKYFAENASLQPDEIEDLLVEILDAEFDTIIEDGSVAMISSVLCKHHRLCQEGRESEVLASLAQKLPRTETLTFPTVEDYHSDEDIEMQNHINTHVTSQLGNLRLDGHNASQQAPQRAEPDEDGWTVVRHGRRT